MLMYDVDDDASHRSSRRTTAQWQRRTRPPVTENRPNRVVVYQRRRRWCYYTGWRREEEEDEKLSDCWDYERDTAAVTRTNAHYTAQQIRCVISTQTLIVIGQQRSLRHRRPPSIVFVQSWAGWRNYANAILTVCITARERCDKYKCINIILITIIGFVYCHTVLTLYYILGVRAFFGHVEQWHGEITVDRNRNEQSTLKIQIIR